MPRVYVFIYKHIKPRNTRRMPYTQATVNKKLRITVTANSLEELFTDSLRAAMHVLSPSAQVPTAASRRKVLVKARNTEALLLAFINEALAHAHAHHEIYLVISMDILSSTHLQGFLQGVPVKKFDVPVQKAKYETHLLQNEKGEWVASFLFS